MALSFVSRHQDAVTVFLQESRELTGRALAATSSPSATPTSASSKRRSIEGTASGGFVDVPPAIASKAILAMANWGYTWFDPTGPLSADDVADVFAGIALRGLESR